VWLPSPPSLRPPVSPLAGLHPSSALNAIVIGPGSPASVRSKAPAVGGIARGCPQKSTSSSLAIVGVAPPLVSSDPSLGHRSKPAPSTQHIAGSVQSTLPIVGTPATAAGSEGPEPAICHAALFDSSRSAPAIQPDGTEMAG